MSKEQIRVNCIAPAIVETPMSQKMFALMSEDGLNMLEKRHLLGFGEPNDVANMVIFLLGDSAKWVTGSCMVIDGGYSLTK